MHANVIHSRCMSVGCFNLCFFETAVISGVSVLATYLSPDPGVWGTVSGEEVSWAKDAKATSKLLAAGEGTGGGGSDHSALFAAVQAQNASLLKLFEESAKPIM